MMNSAAPQIETGRELSQIAFGRVKEIASTVAGLAIPESKIGMVQSRLNRRLRATGIPSFEAYLDFVESENGLDERSQMINALTTNVSSFFREEHHFETLRNDLLPEVLSGTGGRRLRFWSAGCSTGQEPYSIAMTLISEIPDLKSRDVRILASDIDRDVLRTALAGVYSEQELSGLPAGYRDRFFEAANGKYAASQEIRDLVAFRQLNLMDPWPMTGKFQAVFCRNVVIYFSDDTQNRLWPRFADAVQPGGYFFLGHSERMHDPEKTGFDPTGVTTYRKNRPADLTGRSGKD